MSHNPGITVHPNRVYVKELPTDVTREELMTAFSGFGLRIRAARVVETRGTTNYGFITFDTKDEADAVIHRSKSDRGIVVRGRRIMVDHAYSRKTPPRRNSRQFAQAFQGLCRSITPNADSGPETQQQFMHPNYAYQYADQRCANSGDQMHYPVQTSQHYNNICYDGRPMYMTSPNPGMPGLHAASGVGHNGHVQYQHGSLHGNVHPSYVTAHHPGLNGQLYVENPAEGVEAPAMTDFSTSPESATGHCADTETQVAFDHQMHSRLHQTQLQQHMAQQHHLLNASWIQYAQYQHPHIQRRNSEESDH